MGVGGCSAARDCMPDRSGAVFAVVWTHNQGRSGVVICGRVTSLVNAGGDLHVGHRRGELQPYCARSGTYGDRGLQDRFDPHYSFDEACGGRCVRIAVDAQGNPVAVVVQQQLGRGRPQRRHGPRLASLPNTSTSDDGRIGSRDTIVMVVLGGELAVPCTRNPLQRG